MESVRVRLAFEATKKFAEPYGPETANLPSYQNGFAEFATVMYRELKASTSTTLETYEKLTAPIYWTMSAPLSMRGPTRDWRLCPSLIAPLVKGLMDMITDSETHALSIHQTAQFMTIVSTIENEASKMGYSSMTGKIRAQIVELKAYQDMISPVCNSIVSFAKSNMLDTSVSICSHGFSSETDQLDDCCATDIAIFLAERKLKISDEPTSLPPFIVRMDSGEMLRTNNPYLMLIFAVCRSVLHSISRRLITDDLDKQLAIVGQWAQTIQTSEELAPLLNPSLYVDRARTMLAVYRRTAPMRQLLSSDWQLSFTNSNPIFELTAGWRMLSLYDQGRKLRRVLDREPIFLRCLMLARHLLITDQEMGNQIVKNILDIHPDLRGKLETKSPFPISMSDDVMKMLETYFML